MSTGSGAIHDRVAAGAVGAVFGAFIGLALAWLFGVYSNRLGPGQAGISFLHWAFASGSFFALVGLLFGPFVGTLLGAAIEAVFRFEGAPSWELPAWLHFVFLVVFAAGAWWWLSK